MSNGTTSWPGPALLVPVTVEVLIITNPSYNAQNQWWWGTPNYQNLQSFAAPLPDTSFGATIYPNPPGTTSPFIGAVVYWSLPDALTHGTETSAGTIEYPAVPNRWIVTRKSPNPADPAQWSYSSWIVASDYASTSGTNGSQFLNPTGTIAGNPIGLLLGNSWPLSQWPGEPAVSPFNLVPPLTAIGPGDPAFAAFVPNVINVFAYADSLADLAPGFMSYSVYGYYSELQNDPLYGWQSEEEWKTLMRQLEWSAGDDADLLNAQAAAAQWAVAHGFPTNEALLPARTICHGLTFNVQWPGLTNPAPSGTPPTNSGEGGYIIPQVAIGNSAVDALAAMLATDEPAAQWESTVDILEAFQYGCLSLAGSQAELDVQLQNGWFSSAGGRTTWQVVAPGGGGRRRKPAGPVALTKDQAALLMELNVAQQALDACAGQTGSLQTELFSLWWKNCRLPQEFFTASQQAQYQGLINAEQPAVESLIIEQFNVFAVALQQRDAAFIALTTILGDLQLQAGTAAAFLAPNEPVVMISGVRRSYLHGEDDRFASGGPLFCRFTGQTVASITIPGPLTITAGSFGLGSFGVGPPELDDLAVESFFLDVTNAPVIAQAANPSNPWLQLAAIEEEQTLIWNSAVHAPLDQQTLAELSGLTTMYGLGAIPSKVGVQLWSPPWSPLFLQWQVTFTPAASDQASALTPWTPPGPSAGNDGTLADFDDFTYQYAGPLPPLPTTSGSASISGMSLLMPQATDVLAARIEELIAKAPPGEQADVAALQDVLTYIQSSDLLAQALSGFNQALLQRDPDFFRVPDDCSMDTWLSPATGPQFQPLSMPSPDAPDAQFNPIRAGHLQVTSLWVVDAFGQVFDVFEALLVNDTNFQPLLGPDLITPGINQNPTLVELKPRIVQFSRFLLTFLAADNDQNIVGLMPEANPICGWLIPNHLDGGILVYGAGGDFLGELLPGVWVPPPDVVPANKSSRSSMGTGNVHLRAIVNGILQQNDSAGALQALMDLMQQMQSTLDPNGGWADQELPALIGLPLAVVRATAQLQLLGLPAWSQTWANTNAYDTAGFDQVQFPVQLGSTELADDGVAGYFINDDYTQIQSVYAASSPYAGNTPVSLAFNPASAALLTLIVDPTAGIHAITGIYPPLAFELPTPFTTPALSNMEILFRTGPVLGQAAPVGMPLPSLREGTWSWLQYADPASVAVSSAVLPAGGTAAMPHLPTLAREGWLKLILGGPATEFTYAMSPLSIVCSPSTANPNTVTLTITVYNGSGADVDCSGITFAFAVGTEADDLTSAPSTIAAAGQNTNWTISPPADGQVTATPPAGSSIVPKGTTLTLTLTGVQVNSVPGTTTISVTEISDATREGSLAVTKVSSMN